MKTLNYILPLFAIMSGTYALAHDGGHEGPCKQIKEACESAGFVKGKSSSGKGLWKDCVGPIMQGNAAPNTLPTPIDPSVISACKMKHPNFGSGKHEKGNP